MDKRIVKLLLWFGIGGAIGLAIAYAAVETGMPAPVFYGLLIGAALAMGHVAGKVEQAEKARQREE